MTEAFTLPKREDNSTEDAEKLVAWARKFEGADAHIVMDYITEGSVEHGNLIAVPGALNGVTVQWDHDGDGNADLAVHVPAGATVTRAGDGTFEVSFTMVRELPAPTPENADATKLVTSDVIRTVEGDVASIVSEVPVVSE